MQASPQTFTKSERLCSKKAIAELFENGRSFYSSTFQVIWIRSENEMKYPAQVAISVSKKGFKLATDRNLIRRRIREAWRKNKHLLYEFLAGKNIRIVLIVIFKGNIIPDYSVIEKSVAGLIGKLISDIP